METSKITPFLWYNDNASEAVNFYTSIFGYSKILNMTYYDEKSSEVSGKPVGSVMTIDFQLEGKNFIAINGGPDFKFNPTVSFLVTTESREKIDKIWQNLSKDGDILMDLDKYPFSEKYGWVQDKYGLSWQLNFSDKNQIIPSLLFSGKKQGMAEEAINFYTSIFKNSNILYIARYEADEGPEGKIKYSSFSLDGNDFVAMDSGSLNDFDFSLATSFVLNCQTQEEINYFWNKFTENGGEEIQCGWLKDKFGVAWQIVPNILNKMLADKDSQKSSRVMSTMLQMVKIEIEPLIRAYEGK